MKNRLNTKKGISLITLIITIVVIIILAAAVILTLGDNNPIDKAKEARRVSDIANIKEEIQMDVLGKQLENAGDISDATLQEILEKYGTLSEEENLMDKILTTTKEKYEIKVSDIFKGAFGDNSSNPVVADKSGVEKPNLNKIAQKTYVTWNLNEEGTGYEINDKQTTQPDNWYDYENGKWANIKTTNKISDTETLEAYWVWIPRYEYVVPTSATAEEIEVKFIKKGQTVPDEGYTIHPAFTNEGNGGLGELDGIWVAKFEASSNATEPDTNYGGGNDSDLKVQIKPGVQSWRNISTNNIFTVCRKLTNTGEVLAGSKVDSHMMKNTEWGAVAILSQSKYGIFNPQSSTGTKIWSNPNGYSSCENIYTGYAGNIEDASTAYDSVTAPTNVYPYNTVNGTKASTTGTIYGVYDMAGGSWEFIAGCLKGKENSIFGVATGDSKYVDLYINPSNSYIDSEGGKIGDATKETKGWNGQGATFIVSSSPVFVRGRLVC